MFDTKTWWQSRTIWLQLVAVLFALLGPLGLLPHELDQEDVVSVVMAIVSVVTIVLRVLSRRAIGRPSKAAIAESGARLTAIGLSVALPLAMLGSLSACVTSGTGTTTAIGRIDRIAAGYAQARAFADLLLPFFSPEQANRVRAAAAIVDDALALARSAATFAAREAAIAAADKAAADFRVVAGA